MDTLLDLNDKEGPVGALKPEEEVARFTVDEHLGEVEKVVLFLSGGQLVQQRWGIESLPALLKSKGRAGWDAVKDVLLATLRQLDAEAQIAAAEGLRLAVQQRALAAADAADCLLPLAVSNARAKDKSADVESESWLQLLLELCSVVGSAQLLSQVLPLALACGEVNEPVASRVACCRLLGGMAPHLVPSDVSARFAAKLLAACQDTDYQVRIAAAQQLPVLALALGHAATVMQLLPELIELLADDEVQVRTVAMAGLVAMCEQLPHDARATHLLPLVRRHMQPLELELPLQRTLADAFPRLLAAFAEDLEPSDAGMMYSCFRHLAARTDVELRRTAALRVCQLMAAPLPGSSPVYLHDTWTDLALDHDEQVRVAIASQLHLMARQAAPSDAARLLRRPLSSLLRDGSAAVREALLSGLADTLLALAHVDEMHREGLASDIHQGLLVLAGNLSSSSWRCQAALAAALPALPALLAPEALSEHWAPYAFGLLLNGATCAKPAAARGLAHLLRGCRRERPRSELYCRIMRELAWGRSCWARLAFIQLCVAALAVFSCRWFKDHLLLAVMDLLADGVPNVRLMALGLLPALKQTIRLPEDVQQLEQLNSAMSNLMTDNDRDVSHAARALHSAYKRTPLRMTGGAGLLDINGSSSGAAAAEFEAADRLKEEGEAELTLAADELERLNLEWCAINGERRGRRSPAMLLPDATASSSSRAAAGSKGSGAGGAPSSRQAAGGGNSNSSSSSSSTYGLGGTSSNSIAAAASGRFVASGSSSSTALQSWSSDRRVASSTATATTGGSTSTASCVGPSLRSAGAAAAAAASFSSLARAGTKVTVSSSSSSPSVSSPRPAAASSSSSAAFSSPVASPTGSALLAHMRFPVLAGSPKAALLRLGGQGGPSALQGGSSLTAPGSPKGGGGGSSSSSSRAFGGSLAAAAAAANGGAKGSKAGGITAASRSKQPVGGPGLSAQSSRDAAAARRFK